MNYRANNEKSENIVRTVNHLVALTEAIDLQRLPFLFYIKNHLVIVLMVSTQLLLSSCRTHHGEFFPFPRILPYLHLSLRLLHNFWCFCGKTFGVFVVNHNDSVYFAILVFSDMFWARVANGSCPSGASTLPMWGKHVAQPGQAPCPCGASIVPIFKPKTTIFTWDGICVSF